MPPFIDAPPMNTGWSSFSNLTRLGFRPNNDRDVIPVQRLHEMRRLVELDIRIMTRQYAEAFSGCLFLLSALKSLSIDQLSMGNKQLEMADDVAMLTKLTRLSLKGLPSVRSMYRLTEMVDLEVHTQDDIVSDLLDALLCMPRLASLKIVSLKSSRAFRSSAVRASRLFPQLTALKTLALRSVFPDGACIEALGVLPDLTELRFDTHNDLEDLRACYAQLSLLSSLRVLETPTSWAFEEPRVKLLSGCLPRLREIKFRDNQLNADERAALLREFPCLRRLPPS